MDILEVPNASSRLLSPGKRIDAMTNTGTLLTINETPACAINQHCPHTKSEMFNVAYLDTSRNNTLYPTIYGDVDGMNEGDDCGHNRRREDQYKASAEAFV